MLGVPPPALLTYLCPGGPCFSSSDVFLFCLSFHQPPGLCLSCLPLFFLFLRPCLIHARMPDWGRAFVHGHTFLHSWTHFLAFMDTLSCIHGHTFLHSWTHFLAFMEWADDIGSGPAAYGYVPVQSYSSSLRVFYRTLVVGKDTYEIPNISYNINDCPPPGGFILVPVLAVWHPIPDAVIGILGASSRLLTNACYAPVKDPSQQWLLYLGEKYLTSLTTW